MKKKVFITLFILTILCGVLWASDYEVYVREGVEKAFSNFIAPEDIQMSEETEIDETLYQDKIWLKSKIDLSYKDKTLEERVSVLFDKQHPEKIVESVASQLEYDIQFFFEDTNPRLDYIWKNEFSSISFPEGNVKIGDCFTFRNAFNQDLGVTIVADIRDNVVLFDHFYSKEEVVGLWLETRERISSLSISGGTETANVDFFSRTGFYPFSYYIRFGLIYPDFIYGDLGILMELPLSRIFNTDFTMISNACLSAYTTFGLTYENQIGFCVNYGLWYEHRFIKNLAYRIKWDHFSFFQPSLDSINDKSNFGLALVFNI